MNEICLIICVTFITIIIGYTSYVIDNSEPVQRYQKIISEISAERCAIEAEINS